MSKCTSNNILVVTAETDGTLLNILLLPILVLLPLDLGELVGEGVALDAALGGAAVVLGNCPALFDDAQVVVVSARTRGLQNFNFSTLMIMSKVDVMLLNVPGILEYFFNAVPHSEETSLNHLLWSVFQPSHYTQLQVTNSW